MTDKFKIWLLTPVGKTIIFVASVILSGILCSAFVTEITGQGKLRWTYFYKSYSFYAIIIYIIILYFYNKFIYVKEKDIMMFLDQDYCKAYIKSRSLPAMMTKYEEMINQGQTSNELVEIQSQLEDLMK